MLKYPTSTDKAGLQKAGSTGSAEPNFFEIFRQKCLVFR